MTRRKGMLAAAGLVAALALATAARGEFDPEAWRTFREIAVAEGAKGDNACVAIDDDVWNSSAAPSLRDLRILRGEVDEIGFAVWVPEKTPARIEERSARVFNRAKRGREASELSLDLAENPPTTNRVRIETPASNFRCAVAVEGSDDAKQWKTLRDDAAILDFSGDRHARFTTVSFPDSRYRYLRVVVEAPAGGEPIDLGGATVFQEWPAEKPALPMLADRTVSKRIETQEAGATALTLDLGARNLPVSKVVFETPDETFVRDVRVSAANDQKSWTDAGGGVIFRVRTDRYRKENLEVEFPEHFGRFVRLRILNGDDPPLAITRLAVQGRPRYVFFSFEAGREYRLFYGNRGARETRYDYVQVFAHIDRGAAVEARLGGVRHNPRFIATRETPAPSPWIQRNQWVLYVALGLAVVGLGLVALRALRRTETPEGA